MTRPVVRPPLSRQASAAFLQTAAAARASIPFVLWSVVAVTSGLVIGLAAVALPPTGAFGIIAVVALILLWSMPDLRAVPDKMVRRLLVLVVIVDLCVPAYYTIEVADLPWISARRIVTFPLIILFAIAFSGSSSARARMAAILRDSPVVAVCAIGFFVMAVLSIFTSVDPSSSISGLIDAILTWYVPLMVVVYAVRSDQDVHTLARILCWCAIFISFAGVVEFVQQKNVFISILPHGLVSQLAADNPAFNRMLTAVNFREGRYRASSTYNVSLSFGEFEAMALPLAYYFLSHCAKARDKLFGVVVIIACWVGIFCSGSRGGYLSAIIATVAFSALLTVRLARLNRRSLAPAVLGVVALAGLALLVARLRSRVGFAIPSSVGAPLPTAISPARNSGILRFPTYWPIRLPATASRKGRAFFTTMRSTV